MSYFYAVFIYRFPFTRVIYSILGGSRGYARVILILRECIWNAPLVSLFLPTFDDTGSMGSPPRQVVYPPVF